jgi:hypothetical protein
MLEMWPIVYPFAMTLQEYNKLIERFDKAFSADKWFQIDHFKVLYDELVEKRDAAQVRKETHEEKLKKEKDELADALISMYSQYCADGHDFMSAGEQASTVLEMQGYVGFDEAGRMLTPEVPVIATQTPAGATEEENTISSQETQEEMVKDGLEAVAAFDAEV